MQPTNRFVDALSKDHLLRTIPSGLFLVDNDRRIVFWNRDAERITGYSEAETIGRHCSFLEGIECGSSCGLFDEDAPAKPIFGAECHIRTKSGGKIIISKNVDVLYRNGAIIAGIESFIDITQLKQQAEQLHRHGEVLERTVSERTAALREEQARLRTVLDGMPDFAYIISRDRRVAFFNKAMEEMFGPRRGFACFEVLQGTDSPCPRCPLPQILQGQVVKEERRLAANNRTYEVIHTSVHTPDGELQKLAVCRDVTERQIAADKLVALNKKLDAFAHTVSHDLRSPLTGILGYSELLHDRLSQSGNSEDVCLLQEIVHQGRRMIALIDDLLKYSTTAEPEWGDEEVDPAVVARQVVQDNQLEFRAKDVQVAIHELPSVMFPQTLLYELLSNLMLNALRHGCSRDGRVEVRGEKGKDCYALLVVDYGQGIPADERETVFKVFSRGSGAAGTEGTGVGLFTVKRIVDDYRGKVQLLDSSGGGCTVRVELPLT